MRKDILERREEILKWIEDSNHTISHREICERLNCRITTMHSYFKKMGIEYNGNQSSKNIRIQSDDVFFAKNSTRSNAMIKQRLLQYSLIPYECSHCDIKESWNGKPINLHLDHINGDNRDNRLDNLRFLCPNCHSQTDTYCGKSINRGKLKVSDEDLKAALKEHHTIRKALMSVGLSPKGGNYNRCHKILGTVI
jgi:predicted DNA binding CopG/RHH family protein